VLIYANIGSDDEVEGALENGAEGIGLLRSELLYLTKASLPNEDELFEAYKSVITKMQGKRVIIRTLDVGADKKIPYLNLANEENPALGLRGIRVCLQNKELFKAQIRAILRASAYGKASIMLPMIISKSEVIKSKSLIEECKQELFDENQAFDSKIELGIMIETPASAIMCNELAECVKFFSVGTNDLIQYTLAVDRQNPSVAHLANDNLEPVLRLIRNCADAIHRHGGFIGICGELASDLSLTELFLRMGIDELSVSPRSILSLRDTIRKIDLRI
jgi:phosphotransferase system enzyme I (PtsI)